MNGELKYNAVFPYKKPPPTENQILERYEKHKAKVQEYNKSHATEGNKYSRDYFRDKIKPDPVRYAEYKEKKKTIYHLNNPPYPSLPIKEFN
jgi:hypothetical protein